MGRGEKRGPETGTAVRLLSPTELAIEMQIESRAAWRNYDSARGNVDAASSRKRPLLFHREEEAGKVKENGAREREEVNQFESPSSDPAAREKDRSAKIASRARILRYAIHHHHHHHPTVTPFVTSG